jgi:hypothetical protein
MRSGQGGMEKSASSRAMGMTTSSDTHEMNVAIRKISTYCIGGSPQENACDGKPFPAAFLGA